MVGFFYIILALLGLGVIVFVHELGHYFAAQWVGMRVETFSIGFGKAWYRWYYKGVEWRICWLPFGGYVRLGGMEKEGDREPHEIADGFYGKRPIDRLRVVLAGPVVNFVFAFAIFALLWGAGGREKPFSAHTDTIGWVDFRSELYARGVRPGDRIIAYDGHPFEGFKDHIYAPMFSNGKVRAEGVSVVDGEDKPFDYVIEAYQHPLILEEGVRTLGVLGSASYLFYDKLPDNGDPLVAGSLMKDSGIRLGDRFYWVDGEVVYCQQHLSHLLNDGRALLTVKRGEETFLVRVPRVRLGELKIDLEHREEISDWQYEAGFSATKFVDLYGIPYNLDDRCTVENRVALIDRDREEEVFPSHWFSQREQPLKRGDIIIAVDGEPVAYSYELLERLQTHRVHIIVERNSEGRSPVHWGEEEPIFIFAEDGASLEAIAKSIGTDSLVRSAGRFVLLDPVIPKERLEFALTSETRLRYQAEMLKRRKELESIADTEKRSQALAAFEEHEQEQMLGVLLQDRKIYYNPGPFSLFTEVCREIWRMLSALVMGHLSPKFVGGPIGIVQVMQVSWMVSFKEAMFWLGAISLNLGVLNLLPIPVLDGGYICISLFEMATGRRLKPKTVERMIIPFAVLFIGLMVFLTFNDLSRILRMFFNW